MDNNFLSQLTFQQRAFVAEYVLDFNATRAALAAKYSPKSASSLGYQLLQNPIVRSAVAEKLQEYGRQNEILKQRVINQLANLAFSDIRDYLSFNETGVVMKSSEGLTSGQAAALLGIKETQSAFGSNIELKLAPKEKSLELLGKHLGLFVDKSESETATPSMPADRARLTFEEFCILAGYPKPYAKQTEAMEFGIRETVARMILGARGYGKTDYVVVLGIAYTLYLDPSKTFFIITKSPERNAAILKEIKTACNKAGLVFEVENSRALRIAGHLGKDHSVSAATVNSATMRGRHPHMVIMDDPVTPDDSSESVRRKAKAVYDEASKLTPNVLIIGQPVHKFDLYETLRKTIKCLELPYGSIPELDADLDAQRLAGVDEASIQASYYLNVRSESQTPFDGVRYLKSFPAGDSAVAFIDPSFEGGDYTALTIMKSYLQGVAVVGFVYKKAWNHCIEEMAENIVKYNVKRLCFETNSLGEQPLDILRVAFKCGVVGRKSNGNKHSRIVAAGMFSRMIHISKESHKTYIDQVVQYEYKAKHDDAPDSLASCLTWLGLVRGKQ